MGTMTWPGSNGGPSTTGSTSATAQTTGIPRPRVPAEDEDPDRLTQVRALVADPDTSTRELLAAALRSNGIGSVAHAGDAVEAAAQLATQPAGDLVLVSLEFGPVAAELVTAARRAGWSRVIALAPAADIGPVIDAVGAGVHGVLIGRRSSSATVNLPSTVRELSAREIEVLHLVADGRSNKWIGERLSLSALTVKSHLARIGRKLGTGDRAHMVALALRAGVIS